MDAWAGAGDARALATPEAVLADHARAIDQGWVMSMAFNVLVMQAGFAALEVRQGSAGRSGFSRGVASPQPAGLAVDVAARSVIR